MSTGKSESQILLPNGTLVIKQCNLQVMTEFLNSCCKMGAKANETPEMKQFGDTYTSGMISQ
jgi:hypothetical protein